VCICAVFCCGDFFEIVCVCVCCGVFVCGGEIACFGVDVCFGVFVCIGIVCFGAYCGDTGSEVVCDDMICAELYDVVGDCGAG
jgi:hypothetical protein